MLTPKQEKYVQNLIKGMSQRDAYRNAYPDNKSNDKTIDETACRLFNDSKIHARYEELIKKTEDETIMNAKERRKWLTKVINGEIKHTSYDGNGNEYENEAYISDKMKAVDILNKMDGEYITKFEGDIGIKEIKVEIEDE